MAIMNKQSDLDNHLFAELERLGDEDLEGDDLKAEIARAKSIAVIAAQINTSRSIQVDVARFRDEARAVDPELPAALS